MERFSKGERVHVEYDGTVARDADDEFVSIRDGDGLMHCYKTGGSVPITAADPESWPPQTGDIWEAELPPYRGASERHEFFIRSRHGGGIIVTPDDGGGNWTLELFKRYNPVLVRRRGQ